MARLTIKEAVAIAPVSESTLRRDIKSGKVSSEKDDRDAGVLTQQIGKGVWSIETVNTLK